MKKFTLLLSITLVISSLNLTSIAEAGTRLSKFKTNSSSSSSIVTAKAVKSGASINQVAESQPWLASFYSTRTTSRKPVYQTYVNDINYYFGKSRPKLVPTRIAYPADKFAIRFENIFLLEPGLYQAVALCADDETMNIQITDNEDYNVLLKNPTGDCFEHYEFEIPAKNRYSFKVNYTENFGDAQVGFGFTKIK